MPLIETNIDYSKYTREFVFSEEKVVANVQSLVSLILKMQRWELEKVSTSSIINQSIVAHIDKYYANIPLSRNGDVFNDNFSSFVVNESKTKNRNLMFCIGDSGCGKSTLLVKTFLDLPDLDNDILPIYLNLNNTTKFICNRMKLLRMICSRYKIKAENILNSLVNTYKFVFLLDGLDEKNAKLKYADIEKAIAQRTDDTFIISCRTNLYRQFLDGIDSHTLFEFKPIDANLRIEYFNKFFTDNPHLDEKVKQISNVVSDSQQDDNVFSNILMLTLLAMHIKESPDYILQFDKRRGTIIDSIATATIEREIKKNRLDITVEIACEIIEVVAIFTYERQQKGQTYSFNIMNDTIKKKIRKVDSAIVEKVISIFVIKNGNTKTYRFIHSQFYDFFVAKAAFNAIKKKRNLNKYMSYNFSIDINAFLSDLIRDDIPLQIYNILERFCRKYLNEINSKEQNDYGRLHLLIMHMQRTGEYRNVYDFAKSILDSRETLQPYVENLLLHSKVAGGLKEEDEEIFFQKLLIDEGFKTRHIGMTLSYYNDELELRLPYYDNGKITYKGVFYAFSRHFLKSDIIKHYYIARRHNIFTMKNILEKRKVVPRKIADFCKSIEFKSLVESDNSTFGQKVKAQYDLLIEDINKYPITDSDF